MTITFHRVDLDLIGMGDGSEGRTRMARLPTRVLATLTALTLRPWPLLQPIARGWLAAGPTILGQLRLQRLHLPLQCLHLSLQFRNPCRLAANEFMQLYN